MLVAWVCWHVRERWDSMNLMIASFTVKELQHCVFPGKSEMSVRALVWHETKCYTDLQFQFYKPISVQTQLVNWFWGPLVTIIFETPSNLSNPVTCSISSCGATRDSWLVIVGPNKSRRPPQRFSLDSFRMTRVNASPTYDWPVYTSNKDELNSVGTSKSPILMSVRLYLRVVWDPLSRLEQSLLASSL